MAECIRHAAARSLGPARFGARRYNHGFVLPLLFQAIAMSKPALTLKFKCKKCTKPVTLYLQKTSACSHITPYQGFCKCGEMMRHATGDKDAVESFVNSLDNSWMHHHHHHH
ncbi:conserved protein of unknown function [Cupriavidus neocaledonicus]|nr:conserved hypothetical protein [Cupriavidus neocaledonicus]SPD48217.1 conserved protein of unknown function [Cupriavidus neocaledonicus]